MNPRPTAPKAVALAKLRYTPIVKVQDHKEIPFFLATEIKGVWFFCSFRDLYKKDLCQQILNLTSLGF